MKKYKTYADFANDYDLVLFNECVNLQGTSPVMEEWFENHTCEKENDEDDCNCEIFQWYAIACSDYDMEFLNKTYGLDIFYSEYLQLYILPISHFGTSWDYVNI